MLKKFFTIAILFALGQSSYANLVDIQQWQLSNGAKVYYVPTPGLPMVDINIMFDAGSARDDSAYGLANMTSSLLSEGTESLTADQIADSFADVGAQFGSSSGRDSSTFSLRTLIEKNALEKSVNTLADILNHPNFPERNFQRLQKQLLLSIAHQQQSPGTLANNKFYELMYGDQPYGHPPIGTKETVEKLNTDEIKAFYQKYYVANNATVILVGDINQAQAKSLAKTLVGKLPAGKKPEKIVKSKYQPAELIEHIAFPSSQTYVRIGDLGIDRRNPDIYALKVGNYILGGGMFSSRLFKNIREEKGYTYNVSSHFIPMRNRGPFIIAMQTRNEVSDQAIDLAFDTMSTFLKNGISDEELVLAKKYIIDSFPGSIASNKDIISYVSMIAFYGLPLDFLDTYRDKIAAVNKQQVEKVVKRYIKPDQMITITVGPVGQTGAESTLTENAVRKVTW